MGFDQVGFYSEIGHRLQFCRRQARRTQAEIASELEITRANYANLESGRQRIAVDVLWRLAVVFGVPLTALVPEPLRSGTLAAPFGSVAEPVHGRYTTASTGPIMSSDADSQFNPHAGSK